MRSDAERQLEAAARRLSTDCASPERSLEGIDIPSGSRFQQFHATNIPLLIVFGAVGAGVLAWERYLERIQLPFALLTGAIALYNVFWIAGFDILFRRLLYVALVAAVAGYLTQLMGVSHGF